MFIIFIYYLYIYIIFKRQIIETERQRADQWLLLASGQLQVCRREHFGGDKNVLFQILTRPCRVYFTKPTEWQEAFKES